MPAPRPPRDLFLPQPTPEGVRKFRALYKKRFGVELDPQEALELATRTLQLVYLCMNPPQIPVIEVIPPRAAKRLRRPDQR